MDVKNKRVMVTGGAGFIGSHVVEELVKNDADVTVVDRLTPGREDNLSAITDKITIVKMDLRQPEFSTFVCRKSFDAILHFAGTASVPQSVEAPYEDFENSLQATVQLLELLRKKCSQTILVVASSAAVYGNPVKLPMEETAPTFPISPYGVTKLAIERYCAVYSRLYNLSTASLRFFSIYGPRQRKLLVYDLISKLIQDPEKLTMFGDGTETRDFIFVKDVARAVLAVLERGALNGEVYNIASGQSHTTLEIAQKITQTLKITPQITFTGRGRAGDPEKWRASISRITQIGFQPEVSLDEGIQQTVAWYHHTLEIHR